MKKGHGLVLSYVTNNTLYFAIQATVLFENCLDFYVREHTLYINWVIQHCREIFQLLSIILV